MRTLDSKLATIRVGRATADDFIIADAKDADMAWGVAAGGPANGGGWLDRPALVSAMADLVAQGEIDIMLASASGAERLVATGCLVGSDVTVAVRGNDSTDVWNPRGGTYPTHASQPFRTANLDAVRAFCDLVLYSVTFTNDLENDLRTVTEFARFRSDAAAAGMRYFLEVFNPNVASGLAAQDLGAYMNDMIVRTLAGVTSVHRPLFLKVAYNGAAAMRELSGHDPDLVVGVLGGAAGTTRDTYELLHQASANGAHVALFGRKIQRAESQRDLVGLMRPVLRGDLTPADAVRTYHDALGAAGRAPTRELDEDLKITDPVLLAEAG